MKNIEIYVDLLREKNPLSIIDKYIDVLDTNYEMVGQIHLEEEYWKYRANRDSVLNEIFDFVYNCEHDYFEYKEDNLNNFIVLFFETMRNDLLGITLLMQKYK